MTVATLTSDMTYTEFAGWQEYFSRRPAEWRSDLRTSLQMQVAGDKRKSTQIFPALSAVFATPNATPTSSLKTSLLFNKMLSAKGGDKLDLS